MGNTTNVRILKSYASDPLIFLLPYTICDDSNFADQNNKKQYIAQPPIFHFSVFIDNISCCQVKQVVFRPLQVPLIRARGWHKHYMICFMASPYIKFVRCEDNMFKKVFKDINYPNCVARSNFRNCGTYFHSNLQIKSYDPLFFKWAILGLFFFIFVFSKHS